MKEKKLIKVTGKAVDVDNNSLIISQAEAVVPYNKGGSAELPDVAPFNSNIVLHGDDGFNMKWISFTADGKVQYFYDDYYEFVEGKIHAERTYWGKKYIFDFELVDEE